MWCLRRRFRQEGCKNFCIRFRWDFRIVAGERALHISWDAISEVCSRTTLYEQYLGSVSIIKVDWSRAAARFEGLSYTLEANGTRRPPTVYSLWRRLIDFLTADFQPRASFIVGFALGIRIG